MPKDRCIVNRWIGSAALPNVLALGLALGAAHLTLTPQAPARSGDGVISFEASLPPHEPPPPNTTPPPITISGQTLLLCPSADQAIGAPSWPLLETGTGGTGGTGGGGANASGAVVASFVPAVSTPITIEAVQQASGDLQVMWTLSLGSAVGPDGVAVPSGALRADVRHTSTIDGQVVCTEHAAISLIPMEIAEKIQLGLALDPVTPPETYDPNARIRVCLGSSCTCSRCPSGVLFAAPFFIIGVCNVPGGETCCQQGCNVACAAHGNGQGISDAWIVGQGQFILCMLILAGS